LIEYFCKGIWNIEFFLIVYTDLFTAGHGIFYVVFAHLFTYQDLSNYFYHIHFILGTTYFSDFFSLE